MGKRKTFDNGRPPATHPFRCSVIRFVSSLYDSIQGENGGARGKGRKEGAYEPKPYRMLPV